MTARWRWQGQGWSHAPQQMAHRPVQPAVYYSLITYPYCLGPTAENIQISKQCKHWERDQGNISCLLIFRVPWWEMPQRKYGVLPNSELKHWDSIIPPSRWYIPSLLSSAYPRFGHNYTCTRIYAMISAGILYIFCTAAKKLQISRVTTHSNLFKSSLARAHVAVFVAACRLQVTGSEAPRWFGLRPGVGGAIRLASQPRETFKGTACFAGQGIVRGRSRSVGTVWHRFREGDWLPQWHGLIWSFVFLKPHTWQLRDCFFEQLYA